MLQMLLQPWGCYKTVAEMPWGSVSSVCEVCTSLCNFRDKTLALIVPPFSNHFILFQVKLSASVSQEHELSCRPLLTFTTPFFFIFHQIGKSDHIARMQLDAQLKKCSPPQPLTSLSHPLYPPACIQTQQYKKCLR